MINWHVIQTYSMSERGVADKLLKIFGIGNSFCPSVRCKVTRRGQTSERVLGAYRGYTFARWDHDADRNLWYDAKNTKHVVGIMGGEFPWPVLDGIVEDWIDRADADSVVPGLEPQTPRLKLGYAAGDHVRLTYGAFENIPAYCDWLDSAGAHLQIKGLLGRNQGVYVPFVVGATLVLDEDLKPHSKSQRRRYRRLHAVRATRWTAINTFVDVRT